MKPLLLTLVLTLLLSACASERTPARLSFGIDAIEGSARRLWPAAPEIPRYQYAGELTGEQNFVRDEAEESGLQKVWRWITGLGQEARPNVLQRPQAVAISAADGRIYVTDVSRAAVFVFDPLAGELKVWEYAAGLTRFASPVGIATDGRGGVWVADADLAELVRLDAEGNGVQHIGKPLLKRPTGLARDPVTGHLYVADTYAHTVHVFDEDGRCLRAIGQRGEAPGQFNYPTHVALRGRDLQVTDTMNSRIQIIPLDGGEPRVVGERGLYLGNLVRPKGVASDSEGNLYVIESYYDRLLVFNADGQFLLPIGGTGTAIDKFYLPAGVTVDDTDRIFIADTFNGRVVIFRYLGGGDIDAL